MVGPHGTDDRRNPISFGPWPRRETIGQQGWAFAVPLWIPLALAVAGASTCCCIRACHRRARPSQ